MKGLTRDFAKGRVYTIEQCIRAWNKIWFAGLEAVQHYDDCTRYGGTCERDDKGLAKAEASLERWSQNLVETIVRVAEQEGLSDYEAYRRLRNTERDLGMFVVDHTIRERVEELFYSRKWRSEGKDWRFNRLGDC